MEIIRRRAPDFLAALFGVSSLVHLFRPQTFESLIPSFLPNPRAVIYVSGVAEAICAAGLLRRTRWAGSASALLLLAVFPGNVQMAYTELSRFMESKGQFTTSELLSFARLPLQVPLIWAALQASKSAKAPSTLPTAATRWLIQKPRTHTCWLGSTVEPAIPRSRQSPRVRQSCNISAGPSRRKHSYFRSLMRQPSLVGTQTSL